MIKCLKQHIITSTGFMEEELNRIKLLTEECGGKYESNLLKTTTVLICNKVNSKKYSAVK